MTDPSLPDLPASPADITVEWLNRVLARAGVLGDSRVVAFALERAPQQGATSEVVVLRPEYIGPSAAPHAFVAKFQMADERIRPAMARGHQREVGFYTHFGADAGIPIPACHFARHDPRGHQTLLLLEFVENAGTVSAKQITPEHLSMVVRGLAAFHAKWWGREEELARRQICDEQTEEFLGEQIGVIARGRDVIARQFAQRRGAGAYLAMLERWLASSDRMSAHLRGRKRTLCHNDFHPGQLCLDAGATFRVFDWQAPTIGLGTDDLSTLLSHTVIEWPHPAGRKLEEDALRLYHEQLVKHGVSDYSFEQARHDYGLSLASLLARRAAYFGTVGVDVLEAYWKGIDPETDMWTGMYARQSDAIDHHRLLSALEQTYAPRR